jgi:hypothetical protein
MAMNAGTDSVGANTMAKSIYDSLTSALGAAASSDEDTNRKKIAAAIAQGVVAHLAAHADVRITTSAGALQRAGGVDTTAPSADRVLAGALE